ncbi:hypothetical protein BDQ17DRAFT_1372459 [Cyathus striatus]|nr:hypothetical protein BDQ17DRAFT_1372459 [Cyathus striatus]
MEHVLQALSLQDPPMALSSVQVLPPELLWTIFEYVLPPAYLFDPSLSRCPDSTLNWSIRMKKSIIAVCKTWYYIGTPLLYDTIVFRRCTQVPALLSSLLASPSLAAFIKHIHINCYFPRHMVNVCFESMTEIYRYCSQLTSLDVIFMAGKYFAPNLIASIPVPSPQKLMKFSCDVELHIVLKDDFDFHLLPGGSLNFPSVVSLQLYVDTAMRTATFEGFPNTLHLPSLLQLTVICEYSSYYECRNSDKGRISFMELLKAYGRKLRYFKIGLGGPEYLDISVCPVLEHLVIGEYFEAVLTPYKHESLQIIDMHASDMRYLRKKLRDSFDWSNFPNLKYIRRLDPALFMHDLPPYVSSTYSILVIEWRFQVSEIVYSKDNGWSHLVKDSIRNLYSSPDDRDLEKHDSHENTSPEDYPDSFDEVSEPDEEYMDDEDYVTEGHDMLIEELQDEFYDADGDWQVDFAMALEIHGDAATDTDSADEQ